ncbi:D-alanyl-D-alanine carboxypeptidase/D-alanyl-D-alanine-endopeptidase [Bifidobacterium bifidum NCIMB 41171]|uniref:D-alanyl-D-alanine carboxypeptidase/D-alanyl-D-alanine-endopeptidase n=1 Tax=Bifidobacterium bifidum TaxID=1681 RepID=UPI000197644E|nr:D-alanyl-D-alanine carboxypeptidase [Bifidobacterium bifidum]EFR51103.1 D-alanyl-D-alanine carboxypeptidase/D-alanyl-D-alanine-endopeptidase [Bifidobacterium bifidum NCIMB 41171]
MASKAAARHHMIRHLPMTRRTVTVAVSAVVAVAVMAGYFVADIYDVAPGILTLRGVDRVAIPDPQDALTGGTVAAGVDASMPVDAQGAKTILDEFSASEGVGKSFSLAIADGKGNIVAEHDATIPRQPASTLKTLTAFAAATTLDMGSTLDTKTYLIQGDDDRKTVVLQGEGDMLLSDGESDPSHINGHAGLGTLAQRTAEALKQRGITQVDLLYDDSLFGQDRTPAGVTENNAEHRYYTAISTMAVDGGRTWTDMVKPANPDDSSQYPVLSQQPALDAATTFAKRLADNGITVTSGPTAGAAPSGTSALASVSSAPLNKVMAFMLRHSDNTLAQLFGRLTALKRQAGNSIKTDTQAVADTLTEQGIDTSGLQMADCSGLTPGSKVSVTTLIEVQERNLTAGIATAAAEGLSIPGLVGTARNRIVTGPDNGLFRVKTGSLDAVTSLAGNVSRVKGGVLSFAVIVNDPENQWSAIAAINVMAAKLAKL